MSRPLIFVTNDDGFQASGLKKLIDIAKELGDVVAVAPDQSRSGQSHSVSVEKPLNIQLLEKEEGFEFYSCTGTPVDAVKFGELVVMKRKPDIILSGINHGSNASINIIYSGTMAAAIEGAIDGVPSIGFSLMDYSSKADFSAVDEYVRIIIEDVLNNGLEEGVSLNVNIPAVKKEEIKGIKVCKQATGKWKEFLNPRSTDEHGDHFWLTGIFEDGDLREDTDTFALMHNYISIVPVQFDFTAHRQLNELKNRF